VLIVSLASLALIAAEPPPAASAPSSVAEAKMLTERAKQEIAQEEKTWAEEAAREKEAEARRRQRFAEFSQDRVRLQQTLAEQEVKLKSLLARMESHQYKDRELQSRFKQLGQVLAARAEELRLAMARGIPYRLDKRLEAVDLLVRDLEGGNVSPEEGMNRLWTIGQNERRLAQDAEVYSGDFVEGETPSASSESASAPASSDASGSSDPIQVKYLRVGKQIMAFSSLDGSKLGVLRREARGPGADSGYAWVREKDMDRAARQAVKAAIATAEGKSVPGFVPMPIYKSAFAASSNGAAK
jgi:hypothetical protein